MCLQDVAAAGNSAATTPQLSHLRQVEPVPLWSTGIRVENGTHGLGFSLLGCNLH